MALSTSGGERLAVRPSDPLSRLAALAWRLRDRQGLCDRLEAALAPLQQSGVWVVDGELELLVGLRERLAAAENLLYGFRLGAPHGLVDRGPRRAAAEETLLRTPSTLDELDHRLEDVAWEVAQEEVLPGLEAKGRDHQDRVRRQTEQVAEWQARVADLRATLQIARGLHAPVRDEQSDLLALEGKVAQADRMLKELNYSEAERQLPELEQKLVEANDLAIRLQRRVEESGKFSQQADLLILRSPPDPNHRVQYTVLLRTPSEPGAIGVNIQASSVLAQQDSDRIRVAMRRVTGAINAGADRAFPPPGAVPAAGAPASRALSTGGARERVTPGATLNDMLRDIGDLLFRLVVPEQMHPFLTSTCSLTITTNDLELPWELMLLKDEAQLKDEALCVRQPLARMPMGRALPRRPRTRTVNGKLRFLLVHADPVGNLSLAGEEIRKIEAALKDKFKDQIEVVALRPDDSSGERLNDDLRRGGFDIIHYAGHAVFDENDGDMSGLLLRGQEVFFAQKIRRILEGRPLVFLNACESGHVANEAGQQKVGQYLQVPAEGLASAFIYGGAVACIGSVWPVYDGPAADFAVAFYQRVLSGYALGEAMRLARKASREASPGQVTWASYVLYGDPRFQLVE